MSQPVQLAFNPIREELYGAATLFEGFDPDRPDSYAATPDMQAYSLFQRNQKSGHRSTALATLQALHDNSVTRLAETFLAGQRAVAIMGGHKMERGSPAYRAVVRLSAALAARSFLVCSGGGPGAMEAAHLGAISHALPDAQREAAVDQLAASGEQALPPEAIHLADAIGAIDPVVARRLHAWFAPAMKLERQLRSMLGKAIGRSLAVPTWLYGHEPSTPFATDIAKYFQNSLREDGLVTIATSGIVYTEGKAGTLQEIFQDAAQNYYGRFCPMVFLSPPDAQKYWEEDMPVRPLIEALLKPRHGQALFDARVKFTASESEALKFLQAHTAP